MSLPKSTVASVPDLGRGVHIDRGWLHIRRAVQSKALPTQLPKFSGPTAMLKFLKSLVSTARTGIFTMSPCKDQNRTDEKRNPPTPTHELGFGKAGQRQMGRDHLPRGSLYQHLLRAAERKFRRRVEAGETPHLFFGVEPPQPRIEAPIVDTRYPLRARRYLIEHRDLMVFAPIFSAAFFG